MLAATGSVTPANLAVMALGGGCMAAFGFPAYQAILPDLVPKDDLLGAISLSSAQWNLGRVVGPALAGLVLALGSYTFAFVLNALSFGAVFVAIALVRLPPPRPDPEETGGIWRRIVTGARGGWAEPGCRAAILAIAVAALLLSPFIALIPAVAVKLFDAGERGTSILVTAQGVGAVAGALAMAPLARRFGRRRVLLANLVLLPGLLASVRGGAVAAAGRGRPGRGGGGLHRHPLRAGDGGAAPGAERPAGPDPQPLRGGPGRRLPHRGRDPGGAGRPLRPAAGDVAGAAVFLAVVLAARAVRPDLAAALDDPDERGPSGQTGSVRGRETAPATLPGPRRNCWVMPRPRPESRCSRPEPTRPW